MSELHNTTSYNDQVLVVIPCLNEEKYIEKVLASLATECDRINLNIVVADGGSTDQTRTLVHRLALLSPRITLMDNPKRIQAAAMNDAVRQYGADARFIIRVDAHATYPDHFCAKLLAARARTNADSVVVSMHAAGSTCLQRAAAAAQNSLLGNGGSAHRNRSEGRWVDHGHHALMTTAAFKAVGGYDEAFSHNEDAELDVRLTKSGFRIYLIGDVQVTYYPRDSLAGLFWQYFNIGRGRARNFLKHRKNAKFRHLILAAVAPVVCIVGFFPLSPIFALPALLWTFICLGYGLVLGFRLRDRCASAAGVAAMITQAGWSFGFFRELLSKLQWLLGRDTADADRKSKVQRQIAQ
jgi:succinoglycan biosynthesis protein ExoA